MHKQIIDLVCQNIINYHFLSIKNIPAYNGITHTYIHNYVATYARA